LEPLRVLVIGDVVGRPGVRVLFVGLRGLAARARADLVIANGENAADGRGMTPEDVNGLFGSGADVLTSGNHIWQRREVLSLLDSEERLLRPENYPAGVPGKGHCTVGVKGISVGILNLQGRVQMPDTRCPFRVGRDAVARLRQNGRVVIVDFHAESPEEKEALALHLDGRCSLVFGTHTHVQTADERILPGGTGFITDIGMTGPCESVIGMSIDTGIERSQTQMPLRMEVEDAPAEINGIMALIDPETGRTLQIERIQQRSNL
jgi:hypothetical protein